MTFEEAVQAMESGACIEEVVDITDAERDTEAATALEYYARGLFHKWTRSDGATMFRLTPESEPQ